MIRNGATFLLARLIPGIAGVVSTALLTRLLPPEAYGRYGIAVLVTSFGSTVGFEWLGLSFMRFYEGRRDDPRAVPTFACLYAAMSVLAAAGSAGGALLGVIPADIAPMVLAGVATACAFSWFELLARLEVAGFRPLRYLRLNLLRAALLTCGTLGAAWLTRDPFWTACGTCAALCVALLPGLRRLRPTAFDPALARQALRFGAPFALSLVLAGLFNSGVRALVGLLTDEARLGFFTVAYALSFNVLAVLSSALGAATYPLAVRAWERGDRAALRSQLDSNLSLVLAVLAPAALGLALTADDLAAQVPAPGYRAAVAALMPPMALTGLFAGFRGTYLDHAFQLGRVPRRQVAVSAVATGLALAGALALVPVMGVAGAPVATAAAALLSCIHAVRAGRGACPMPLSPRVFAQVGAAAAAMAMAVMAVPPGHPWSLYARTAAGALAYVAAALAVDLLGSRGKLAARLRRFRRGRLLVSR